MRVGEVVFDKYEIIRVIKESEAVSVYEAKHIYLHSSWIIKKICSRNPIYTNEIQILKSLNHENIPLITDVFIDAETTYVIREYIEGKTLGEIIREKGVMSEVMAVKIAIDICCVLEYLHTHFDNPLIYRDIKPDNIILSNQNKVHLIDFGIARFYQSNKDADTEYLGTRGFAAPEQYGMGQTDVRTDVFGVGILLYFMLTRKNLEEVSSRLEPIRFIRDDVGEEVEQIIQKASQFNIEQRYASITQLKSALEKTLKIQTQESIDTFLSAYKDKVICVSGVKSGIGATHVSTTLTKYLLACKKKCVVIDMSENQDLMSLEYTHDATIEEGLLKWNAMTILSCTGQRRGTGVLFKDIFEACDWIVVDFGTHDNQSKQDFIGAYNIIVAGIAPWEMSRLEEFFMENTTKRTVYFINHSNKNQVDELNHSLEHIYVYDYPYDKMEALEDVRYQQFYNEVFNDWGRGEQCLASVTAETFFDIEKFKIKFQKSIKS